MIYCRFGTVHLHLSHYPHASWRGKNHGSIHLYGHSHGSMEEKLNQHWPNRRAMDVGIDIAWRPFSLDEIIGRFA
jgi:calcineurin-like phosphoesterase family protein